MRAPFPFPRFLRNLFLFLFLTQYVQGSDFTPLTNSTIADVIESSNGSISGNTIMGWSIVAHLVSTAAIQLANYAYKHVTVDDVINAAGRILGGCCRRMGCMARAEDDPQVQAERYLTALKEYIPDNIGSVCLYDGIVSLGYQLHANIKKASDLKETEHPKYNTLQARGGYVYEFRNTIFSICKAIELVNSFDKSSAYDLLTKEKIVEIIGEIFKHHEDALGSLSRDIVHKIAGALEEGKIAVKIYEDQVDKSQIIHIGLGCRDAFSDRLQDKVPKIVVSIKHKIYKLHVMPDIISPKRSLIIPSLTDPIALATLKADLERRSVVNWKDHNVSTSSRRAIYTGDPRGHGYSRSAAVEGPRRHSLQSSSLSDGGAPQHSQLRVSPTGSEGVGVDFTDSPLGSSSSPSAHTMIPGMPRQRSSSLDHPRSTRGSQHRHNGTPSSGNIHFFPEGRAIDLSPSGSHGTPSSGGTRVSTHNPLIGVINGASVPGSGRNSRASDLVPYVIGTPRGEVTSPPTSAWPPLRQRGGAGAGITATDTRSSHRGAVAYVQQSAEVPDDHIAVNIEDSLGIRGIGRVAGIDRRTGRFDDQARSCTPTARIGAGTGLRPSRLPDFTETAGGVGGSLTGTVLHMRTRGSGGGGDVGAGTGLRTDNFDAHPGSRTPTARMGVGTVFGLSRPQDFTDIAGGSPTSTVPQMRIRGNGATVRAASGVAGLLDDTLHGQQ